MHNRLNNQVAKILCLTNTSKICDFTQSNIEIPLDWLNSRDNNSSCCFNYNIYIKKWVLKWNYEGANRVEVVHDSFNLGVCELVISVDEYLKREK